MKALKTLLEELEKGGGGLLFVDEAYTLNPHEVMSQGTMLLLFFFALFILRYSS